MINQHLNVKERIDLGLKLKNEYRFQMPLYIDTMKNEMVDIYAGWPLQSFIICNDEIKWNIKPKHPGYLDLDDLVNILEEFGQY